MFIAEAKHLNQIVNISYVHAVICVIYSSFSRCWEFQSEIWKKKEKKINFFLKKKSFCMFSI